MESDQFRFLEALGVASDLVSRLCKEARVIAALLDTCILSEADARRKFQSIPAPRATLEAIWPVAACLRMHFRFQAPSTNVSGDSASPGLFERYISATPYVGQTAAEFNEITNIVRKMLIGLVDAKRRRGGGNKGNKGNAKDKDKDKDKGNDKGKDKDKDKGKGKKSKKDKGKDKDKKSKKDKKHKDKKSKKDKKHKGKGKKDKDKGKQKGNEDNRDEELPEQSQQPSAPTSVDDCMLALLDVVGQYRQIVSDARAIVSAMAHLLAGKDARKLKVVGSRLLTFDTAKEPAIQKLRKAPAVGVNVGDKAADKADKYDFFDDDGDGSSGGQTAATELQEALQLLESGLVVEKIRRCRVDLERADISIRRMLSIIRGPSDDPSSASKRRVVFQTAAEAQTASRASNKYVSMRVPSSDERIEQIVSAVKAFHQAAVDVINKSMVSSSSGNLGPVDGAMTLERLLNDLAGESHRFSRDASLSPSLFDALQATAAVVETYRTRIIAHVRPKLFFDDATYLTDRLAVESARIHAHNLLSSLRTPVVDVLIAAQGLKVSDAKFLSWCLKQSGLKKSCDVKELNELVEESHRKFWAMHTALREKARVKALTGVIELYNTHVTTYARELQYTDGYPALDASQELGYLASSEITMAPIGPSMRVLSSTKRSPFTTGKAKALAARGVHAPCESPWWEMDGSLPQHHPRATTCGDYYGKREKGVLALARPFYKWVSEWTALDIKRIHKEHFMDAFTEAYRTFQKRVVQRYVDDPSAAYAEEDSVSMGERGCSPGVAKVQGPWLNKLLEGLGGRHPPPTSKKMRAR